MALCRKQAFQKRFTALMVSLSANSESKPRRCPSCVGRTALAKGEDLRFVVKMMNFSDVRPFQLPLSQAARLPINCCPLFRFWPACHCAGARPAQVAEPFPFHCPMAGGQTGRPLPIHPTMRPIPGYPRKAVLLNESSRNIKRRPSPSSFSCHHKDRHIILPSRKPPSSHRRILPTSSMFTPVSKQ